MHPELALDQFYQMLNQQAAPVPFRIEAKKPSLELPPDVLKFKSTLYPSKKLLLRCEVILTGKKNKQN